MEETKYITFVDSAGRSIFGTLTEETDSSILVKNPVMIAIQQQQDGRMAIQLYPLFFAEFVIGEDRSNYFEYTKSNIAVGRNFVVEPRIVEQYERITNPVLVPVEEPTGDTAEVIKLFDDE